MTKVPDSIGRYEIVSRIGQGGMGTVFHCRDPILNRQVAVKLFHYSSDDLRERFLREARAAGTLDHPNIVRTYDVGEHDGQPFLVMELVRGTTVAEAIRGATPLSFEKRLEIVESVARALDYAHSHGVVHRDVKPTNIVIDERGAARLLDFGIARIADMSVTHTELVIGTPNYMSPEQIRGLAIDGRSDIFSAGLLLYELLASTRAFDGDSITSVMFAIVQSEPVPLTERLPGLDPVFGRIIAKALQKDPERRYQRATELADALGHERTKIASSGVSAELERVLSTATARLASSPAGRVPAKRDSAIVPALDEHTVVVRPPTPEKLADEATNDAVADGTVFLSPRALTDESGVDARLVIVRSPDARRAGRTVDVHRTPFTLGRGAGATLAVADPGWSRAHATIDFMNDGYVVRDLGSANGTFVNGHRIQASQPLFFGASIRIGDTVLTFTSGRDLTMPDLTGLEIAGRYVLQRLIRESGKAVMYAAKDNNVPRQVAAKILSPGLARFSGYREQFAREAETASQLQHPHICRLLDSGQTRVPTADGASAQTPFLCFEMMAGGDLAERLARLSEVGTEQVTEWLGMLGSALEYAHSQGVVHGGLKPTALVFDLAGHLYLTDFAIAQRALNATGQPLIGSPAFIAPEQWESGAVTPATDQFAFAVLAYYLLTGVKPFEGLDHPEVRVQQFRRGPESAHDVAERNQRPPVSRVVSDVLRQSLSTNPTDRFTTVGAFTAALIKALKEGRRIGNAPRVFISYDREHSGGWVRYFADKLRDKHGIHVFMDTMGLDRAGRFPPRLLAAIEDCDVFVCFLAGSTLASKWVNEEVRIAHDQRKLMIPIFQESYDEAALDPTSAAVAELIAHQGIKLFDVSGHYVDHAVNDLAGMIKGSLGDS